MDPSTTSEVGDSTASIAKALNDGHQRKISVDSGIDMLDGDNSKRSNSTTETDLIQDGVTTDRNTKVYRKNSERACSLSSSFSQASDSAEINFSRSISQESNERVFQGKSSLLEKSSTTCTCTEDSDPQTEGEDYPDCSESAASHAIRRYYDTLLDVILVSVDELESKLYSISLIEKTVHEKMTVEGVSDRKKARQVLDDVMTKLRTADTVKPFEWFMEVLDGYPSCHGLVVKIRAEYQHQSNCSEVSEHDDGEVQHPFQQISSSSSQDTATKRDAVTLSQPKNPSCLQTSRSQLPAFYSPFGTIFLFFIVSLLLLFFHLIALHWTLNADMKKVDEIHPSSAFHENMLLYVTYIEENRQLKEQLRVAQRQILQLNREVLDLKGPRKFDRPCTGTNKPELMCEKEIRRLSEEKIDYVTKIEKPTQQLLLNSCTEC